MIVDIKANHHRYYYILCVLFVLFIFLTLVVTLQKDVVELK